MRPIQDYGLRDWLLADPLRHRLRRLRNLATLAIYNGQKTDRQDELLASLASHVTGEDTAFTVAFNSVRNIEWLADGFARHSRGTTLVVCDNSPTVGARKEISGFCAARGVPYVPLPRPPLQLIIRTNPPLSHGIALTWIFYNLVRPLKPKVFAFIDHDLIPTAPFNFSEKVKDQPVYGRLRAKPTDGERNFWTGRKLTNYWNLWAGYCVFDYAATAHYPLDFTPDNPLRLDTGGQNWTRLYRELDKIGRAHV